MSQTEYGRGPRPPAKRPVLVMFVLLAALCLGCFALGILVGGQRRAAEEPAAAHLASDPVAGEVVAVAPLRQPQVQPPVAPVSVVPPSAPAEPPAPAALTEADLAPPADPLAALLSPPADGLLGSGLNPPPEEAPAVAVSSPPKAERQPEVPAAAVAKPPPAEVAALRVAAVPGGSYLVQVASFRQAADARAVEQKLRAQFPVFIETVDLGAKGVWSRVMVGPVATRLEAEKLQQGVRNSTKLEGFIKKSGS